MKKLLSLILVASFAIISALGTVSATASTATPDEAKTPISMTISSQPYFKHLDLFKNYPNGIGWDYDYDHDNPDLEAVKNYMLSNEFKTTPSIPELSFLVTYSDGSEEVVEESDCTINLLDPPNLGQFNENTHIQVIFKEVCRKYTVEYKYKGITGKYEFHLYSDLKEDVQSKYEFVSYTEPNKTEYVIDVDTHIEYLEDAAGNIREFRIYDYDKTGMTATIRNKKTGELITFNDDEITILKAQEFTDFPGMTGSMNAWAYVTTEDGAIIDFFVKVTHVRNNTEEPTSPVEPETKPTVDNDKDTSTADTATKDTATKDTVNNQTDNNAIQTGNPATAILLVVVMLSATTVAYVFYRKKAE